MRRLAVIVALGALLGMFGAALTASPALAGRGHKWEFLPAQPFTLPASFCGFKVRVAFLANKGYSKILKASDGSVITLETGSVKISFTNRNTGKTITENLSGPGKATTHPDGSVTIAGKGHEPTVLTAADAKRFGLPVLGVIAGHTTISVDSSGNITSLSHKGHVLVDLCAALS